MEDLFISFIRFMGVLYWMVGFSFTMCAGGFLLAFEEKPTIICLFLFLLFMFWFHVYHIWIYKAG